MRFTGLLTGSLTGLACALPATHHARTTTATTTPSPGTSKGFNLRVNVTDPSRDLVPSVQGLYLSDERAGAGYSISVLQAAPATPAFYLNGTAYHTTVTHDIPGVYPLSLSVAGPDAFDALYPAEHDVGAVVSGATELGLRAGEPILFPVDYDGTYAACRRKFVLGGGLADLLTVRYVYGGEAVPADCAPIELGVECATLNDLPAGASWNHDFAFDVPCLKYD
ncbi:hypothetical protein F5Y19DRAFT_479155 [Xylariaceae sp. FL1651]|nr:hypothetical protein F5Y19DRAFT_479155 [Xylariaceae sp. FL1651]